VFVEPGLGWVPFYLDLLDRRVGKYDMPEITEVPSEYFRRNMLLTFMDDPRGVGMRHELGVENIMWSTDFPIRRRRGRTPGNLSPATSPASPKTKRS